MRSNKDDIKVVEVEAKTVKKAIKDALKQLNATEKEVSIEVVKEEQKGLFGMQGAEAAKVRVTLDHRKPS
jgi:spoIIIJ-associated protein